MRRDFVFIQILVASLFFSACLHGTRINKPHNEMIIMQVVDDQTHEPIQNAFAIIVERVPHLEHHKNAYQKKAFSDYLNPGAHGMFRFNAQIANGKEIWFLAPGYKSVPIEISLQKKDESTALKVFSHYLMKTEYAPLSTMGYLAGILQKTTIHYDFDKNLSKIPMKDIRDNPDVWKVELDVGLYELKNKVGSKAFFKLNEFVTNEHREIEGD